jgi:hypothetical protein
MLYHQSTLQDMNEDTNVQKYQFVNQDNMRQLYKSKESRGREFYIKLGKLLIKKLNQLKCLKLTIKEFMLNDIFPNQPFKKENSYNFINAVK